MILLSTRSSICILNVIRTNRPSRNDEISSWDSSSPTSTRLASGGLMSIILPSIDESDVADEPIIWFMASEIADK